MCLSQLHSIAIFNISPDQNTVGLRVECSDVMEFMMQIIAPRLYSTYGEVGTCT
jgi:hypothetical protein